MKLATNVKCPNCGFERTLLLDEGFSRICCDVEDGGCDQYFAVDVRFVTEYKVFKLVDVTIPDYEDFDD